MKNGVIIIAALLVGAIFALPGVGLAVEVEATVDRNRIAVGESVALTVTIRGGTGDVDTSGIRDFEVTGKGTSTNIQIVNGSITKQIHYTYSLIPRRSGRLKIPPLRVDSEGEIFNTREIAIAVSSQGRKPDGANDLFVTSEVTEKSPYEGQQILYTFRFFQAVRTANLRFQKPAFEGFTAKETGEPRRYRATYKGRRYDVTEVGFVLIPVKPGNVTIQPAVLYCDMILQKRSGNTKSPLDSFFNEPFFGRTERRPLSLRTRPVEITVKPLPPYMGSEGFSGLVGRFNLAASLDRETLQVDESATLSVTIEGTGNIIDAGPPTLSIPKSFKVYPDNPIEEIRLGPEGYTGKKVFRSALVAIHPGDAEMGPFRLTYFDTTAGDYRTLKVAVIPVSVTPGKKTDPVQVYSADASPALPKIVKKKVELTGHDILPLKEAPDLLEDRSEMNTGRFLSGLFLPVLLYLVFWLGLRSRRKKADVRALLARRAMDAIRQAKKEKIDPGAGLSRLHEALIAAVRAAGRGEAGESLTHTEILKLLEAADIDGHLPDRAADLLEKIQSAHYGGAEQSQSRYNELIRETEGVVKDLCGRS